MRKKASFILISFAILVVIPIIALTNKENILSDFSLHLSGIFDNHVQNISQVSTDKIPAIYLPIIQTARNTFYVSPNGSDSNPGSLAYPWRTIGKAAHEAYPGIIIYIRGGVYHEVVEVRTSGTANQPIKFMAYPGETPIIDGYNQIPTYWVGLFSMLGEYIQVTGLEVRNSKYDGFGLYGNHNIADNVSAHHNQYHGVLVKSDYGTVRNSRFWHNSLMNEYGKSHNGSSALYIALDFNDGIADHAIIQNNVVWENWGEGISASNADQVLIDNNISHDNYSANIYVTNSTNITVRNNFVYMNPTSQVYGYGANVGIMLGDETYAPDPQLSNLTIVNNIAYGNKRNLYWWRGSYTGMKNVLIAHNTFVNSVGIANVLIMEGTHQNVQFINNLINQDGDLPVIQLDDPSGLIFSNNLWSKTPPRYYPNPLPPGDIVSPTLLERTGSPFSPEWYKLKYDSPAINAATVVSGVTVDYFENPRDQYPDIGGAEYIGVP